MNKNFLYPFLLFVLVGSLACKANSTTKTKTPKNTSQQEVIAESKKANEFFEKVFLEQVDRSPVFQTFLGIKKDYDKWDDLSEERALEDLEITKNHLAELQETFDYNKLDTQTQTSYDLFVDQAKRDIDSFQYRYHNYPVNQMFGVQSQRPAFLINIHQITSKEDAKAYIARLHGLKLSFQQVIDGMKVRTEKGIIPPKFVFPYVIKDSQNVITGAPFDSSGKDSTLFADFKSKVGALSISEEEKSELIAQAKTALLRSVKPAYESLISYVAEVEKLATTDDGAWKFPNGETFYNHALRMTTTTDMTAEEIHQLGLSEVARIHEEMRKIMRQVGFKGSLQEFFAFMKEDKQFYYDETEAGKKAYLAKAVEIIDIMKGRLDELFIVKPKADIMVKAVEPFREASAGKAFYQRPAPDGSRPGVYYANLYKMSDMPKYQMEALAYHEGIPGHHMQLAIATELENIPKFRKFGGYTAYSEGWGLYSEYIPKEMGFYQDPYSDFGRLAMELWRACRLVVDTGIHTKKWTREQGIEYYTNNTPNPYGDAVKMVERHIVIPSQATAYKIGMLKILELREKAKKQLGDKFDIRQFHDVILKNGPVPLTTLEMLVEKWIADK